MANRFSATIAKLISWPLKKVFWYRIAFMPFQLEQENKFRICSFIPAFGYFEKRCVSDWKARPFRDRSRLSLFALDRRFSRIRHSTVWTDDFRAFATQLFGPAIFAHSPLNWLDRRFSRIRHSTVWTGDFRAFATQLAEIIRDYTINKFRLSSGVLLENIGFTRNWKDVPDR